MKITSIGQLQPEAKKEYLEKVKDGHEFKNWKECEDYLTGLYEKYNKKPKKKLEKLIDEKVVKPKKKKVVKIENEIDKYKFEGDKQ